MRAAMRSAIGQEIIERIVRKNWSIGSCLAARVACASHRDVIGDRWGGRPAGGFYAPSR